MGLIGRMVMCSLLVALGAGAEEEPMPGWDLYVAPLLDGEQGGGKAAFPAVFAGNSAVEVLDPTGFTLHMSSPDEPGEERVYAAGEPFLPPAGRWRYWLQGRWSMTPFSRLTVFPSSRERSRVSPEFLPLAPAGRVVPGGVGAEGDEVLWLLHAVDSRGTAGPSFELSRRRPVARVGEGVLMPASTVLAGLWDPEAEGYTALSRPFPVPARSITAAPLERPGEDGAFLLAYVLDPKDADAENHPDVELTVTQGGVEHRPDFVVPTVWGLYGAWYGLRPGPAVLTGGNGTLYLEPQSLELEPGGVGYAEPHLRRRPILDVNLVLPPEVRQKPFSLEVHKLPEEELLASEELSRRAGSHRFTELVHGLMEVKLVTHLAPFRTRVDLTDRQEASITLEPELIEVFGTVRQGGERHPARLAFETVARDRVETTADEEGEYRAVSLQPLLWLHVELEGADPDQQPWTDTFLPPIRESRELDVEIPDAEVLVRVLDAKTRRGIGGARVGVRNTYHLPAEEGEDGGGPSNAGPADPRRERVLATSADADDEGVARLAPPRKGSIEVYADAEGYRSLPDPLVVEIPDPSQDRELEVLLERYGETVELRLTLPDGSPAGEAYVWRVDSTAGGKMLFSGRTDAEGVVRVPKEPAGGQLLLRHPAAAVGIVEWTPWHGRNEAEWTFPRPAGRPLKIRAPHPSGDLPARHASLALWLEGRKLSGSPLRALLDTPARTDSAGYWTAHHLPPAPVAVLVWSSQSHDQAKAGHLDTLATSIPWPWPAEVEVRGVR